MKLNNLSRLAALLLAIMMMGVAGAGAATSFSDLTGSELSSTDQAAEWIEEGYCSTCAPEVAYYGYTEWPTDEHTCLYEQLAAMTAGEAYDFIYALDQSDDYTMAYVYANAHAAHVLAGADPVICVGTSTCAGIYVAPGADHTADNCPWRNIVDEFNAKAEVEKADFVAGLTEPEFENLLDGLGWTPGTTLSSGDVQVVGALPAGTQLTATALTGDKVSDDMRDFIMEQGKADMSILEDDCYVVGTVGYNVALAFYGREIEPKGKLFITYNNVRDPYSGVDHVDAYVIHVLESLESIAAETAAGRTVYYTEDELLTTAYAGTAATQIAGYEGKVVFTLVDDESTSDVVIGADGSVTFAVNSLSDGIMTYAMNMVDSAENFVNKMTKGTELYFYYRLEDETDHTDTGDCSHIKKVVYTNSTDTSVTGDVPHEDYAGRPSTLLCSTVVGYDTETNEFLDGSTSSNYTDESGAFTVYVETESGWVITSYRIGCEGSGQQGENCNTVEAQNLTVVPDESGNYISKITIPCSAKSFGHSSDYVHYVLLLTIEQVSINISVEKSVEPKYVTWDENNPQTLTYTITATNNSTNNIKYKEVQFEDSFFLKGATITSVSASDGTTLEAIAHLDYKYSNGGQSETAEEDIELNVNGGNEPLPTEKTITSSSGGSGWPSQSSSTKTADVVAAYVSVTSEDGNAFWEVGETITLTYTYELTEADALAGILPNTVFVTAFYDPNDDSTTAEDFNTAYVEVLISDSGFGTMQVHKKFEGLSAAQVNQLIGGSFTIDVSPTDSTIPDPTIGTVTKVSDTEYYWNVTGLEAGATYTVTETGFGHSDFAAPTSKVDVVYQALNADAETTAVANATSYTTAAIVAGDMYTVNFTNTYESGDLVITKTVVNNDNSVETAELQELSFPFTVTLKKEDDTALTAKYDYTITSGDTTVSTGTITSGETISLSHGQSATIHNLPAGTAYQVTEGALTDVPDDSDIDVTLFTVSPMENRGMITADITQTAAFTNTYGQSTGSLRITKAVENTTGFTPAQTQFTINVTLTGDDLEDSYVVKNGDATVDSTWTKNTDGTLTGTFIVVHGSDVVIQDIQDGIKYTVTEVDATGFTQAINNTATHGTSGEIDGGETDKVEITNTYKVGSLDVTKGVAGTVTDVYPSNFGFTLEFKDADGTVVTPAIKINDGDVTASDGKYTFTLIDGATAQITGIPQNVTYAVTENAQADGKDVAAYFNVSATGETVTGIVVSGTIEAGDEDSATFTNTAKTGTLTITKTVTGDGANVKDTFLFDITGPNNYKTSVMLTGAASGNSVTLTDLPFGEYTVKENTAWSWRYTVQGSDTQTKEVMPATPTPTADFTNERTENKWLDGEATDDNMFN